MKNGAATRAKKIIYGVSIGGLSLQVAKKLNNSSILTPNWMGINKKRRWSTDLHFYREAV